MGRGRAQTGFGGRHVGPALLLVACLLTVPPARAGDELLDEAAPDFVLKSITGRNLRLSEYRGELVLLSFWAAWCGRCVDQLPEIERLRHAYADAPLTVLSVNLDRKTEDAREAAAELGLGFPVLLDRDKQVARLYDPDRLPLTLLVDPTGVVRFRRDGYDADDPAIYFQQLDELLAEQAGVMTKAGTQ